MPERPFTILATGPFPAAERQPLPVPGNISLEIVPFTCTTPIKEETLTRRLVALSRLSINAIFTSAEAVRAVRSLIPVPRSWRACCISGPTRSCLLDWLGDQTAVISAPDAASLAEEIVSAGLREAVFFCGSRRLEILPDRLKKSGTLLEEMIVYESLDTPVRLEKEYDALLFFSPGAVNSFFSLNRIPRQAAVFALGKTTADALKERITGTVILAPQPDKFLLLQTAVEYAHAHPIL